MKKNFVFFLFLPLIVFYLIDAGDKCKHKNWSIEWRKENCKKQCYYMCDTCRDGKVTGYRECNEPCCQEYGKCEQKNCKGVYKSTGSGEVWKDVPYKVCNDCGEDIE